MTKKLITLKERAVQMLNNHIKDLDDYTQYRDEYSPDDDTINISDLIRDLDIDSIEFNAGFEQGYMRSLEELINTTL